VKIAINIEYFSMTKGGAERSASQLAEALPEKGYWELARWICSWRFTRLRFAVWKTDAFFWQESQSKEWEKTRV